MSLWNFIHFLCPKGAFLVTKYDTVCFCYGVLNILNKELFSSENTFVCLRKIVWLKMSDLQLQSAGNCYKMTLLHY